MREDLALPSRNASRRVVASLLLAGLLLGALFGTIAASQDIVEALPPDLSNSGKSVNLEEAELEDTLHYSVSIRNDGGGTASEVLVTDTLPAELDYVSGSLEVVPDIGLYGEDNDVITWTGALNVNQEIVLNFQAVLTGEVSIGASITNTVVISAAGQAIERSASTAIVSDTTTILRLPLVMRPAPSMGISLLSGPNSSNQWTIGLSPQSLVGVTGYEIQEAQSLDFNGAALIQVNSPAITSVDRSKTPSFNNTYYYRARTTAGLVYGPWSNVIRVDGSYLDNFDDANSGWRMVRQDTDDVDQTSFYSNGRYVHRQFGRWDYMISSPVRPAPQGAYRVESRIRFVGQDNLHAYGMIFGGDWNGSSCPNGAYSSCFNHYYRLLVIWFADDSGKLRIQLKRIDFHDVDNVGRGEDLVGFRDVAVNSPPSGWQDWAIDVHPDGRMEVRVNGNLVITAQDTTYINDRYFGAFSATNEYAGLRVELDWYRAYSLK